MWLSPFVNTSVLYLILALEKKLRTAEYRKLGQIAGGTFLQWQVHFLAFMINLIVTLSSSWIHEIV